MTEKQGAGDGSQNTDKINDDKSDLVLYKSSVVFGRLLWMLGRS